MWHLIGYLKSRSGQEIAGVQPATWFRKRPGIVRALFVLGSPDESRIVYCDVRPLAGFEGL